MIRKGFPERVLCRGHLRLKVIGPQYLKSRDPLLGPCKRFFNRRASSSSPAVWGSKHEVLRFGVCYTKTPDAFCTGALTIGKQCSIKGFLPQKDTLERHGSRNLKPQTAYIYHALQHNKT